MKLNSLAFYLLSFTALGIGLANGREARDDAMEKIADVVAFARACPKLEMDTVSVTTVVIAQSIGKTNRDYDLIDAMANAREGAILRGNAAAECETGRLRYGPGGNAYPGLLRDR